MEPEWCRAVMQTFYAEGLLCALESYAAVWWASMHLLIYLSEISQIWEQKPKLWQCSRKAEFFFLTIYKISKWKMAVIYVPFSRSYISKEWGSRYFSICSMFTALWQACVLWIMWRIVRDRVVEVFGNQKSLNTYKNGLRSNCRNLTISFHVASSLLLSTNRCL